MVQGDESKLSKLVRIYVKQLQDVENTAADVRFLQWFVNATGAQLDGIGELVGEERLGRDDADYKDAIYFKMYLNAGHGEPELLITALRRVTQSVNIQYKEIHPAKVLLSFNGSVIPDNLKASMQTLCPAGVDLYLKQITTESPFILSETDYIPPDTEGLGFGDTTDSSVGGRFSQLI